MTAPTPVIVPGEEELGIQRQCRVCGDWWPVSEEFFNRDSRTGRLERACRACDRERDTATQRARRERRRAA